MVLLHVVFFFFLGSKNYISLVLAPLFWRGHWHKGVNVHSVEIRPKMTGQKGVNFHTVEMWPKMTPPKEAEKNIFLGLFLERVRAPKTSQISTVWKFTPFWEVILGQISTAWKFTPFWPVILGQISTIKNQATNWLVS